MSAPCTNPIAWEELVAYWAADLDAARLEAVEEHVFGCEACTRASARVAEITETLRSFLPPLLTRALVAQLAGRGLRVLENPMAPGERREVLFPADVDVLVHVLGGLDLSQAASVGFVLRAEAGGPPLVEIADAPFEAEEGAVLVACQQHYAAFPHDTVAEVRVRDARGGEKVTSFTILHRFAAAGG